MKKLILLLIVTVLGTSLFAQVKPEDIKTELKKYKAGAALVDKYLNKL